MKTDRVYFGDVYRVEEVKTYYCRHDIRFNYLKPALVLEKRNLLGKKYMYDLNTKEKYTLELSSKLGSLHISRRTLERFDCVLGIGISNLPKNEVLKLGNPILKSKKK